MDIGKLVYIMRKEWKMEQPNLLISVTGGAKDFSVKPGLMEVFRHGLIKAAESTGILLFLYEIVLFGLRLLDIRHSKIMSICYKLRCLQVLGGLRAYKMLLICC